jgi:hypothetical protein
LGLPTLALLEIYERIARRRRIIPSWCSKRIISTKLRRVVYHANKYWKRKCDKPADDIAHGP